MHLAERYRLDALIGRGGMADVYRAFDERLARLVAVKIFRVESGDSVDCVDEAASRRHQLEGQLMAGLRHPGLVEVHDAGVDQTGARPRPYLVLELVEAPTLSELLRDGPLPAERVAAIGAALADALDYIHERHIVHRDVKPSNVLVPTPHGAKLTDFGIAVQLGSQRLTSPGLAIGTASYLSPEQVKSEEVTGAADVYSLGLVLLEALTGERAFPGPIVESALARLAADPPVPDDLEDRWAALLRQMTDRDPALRPSAAAVAGRLARLGEPPSVSTMALPVLAHRPRRARRARRALAGLAAAAVLGSGTLVLLGATGQPTPIEPQPSPSVTRQQVLPAPRPSATPVPPRSSVVRASAPAPAVQSSTDVDRGKNSKGPPPGKGPTGRGKR